MTIYNETLILNILALVFLMLWYILLLCYIVRNIEYYYMTNWTDNAREDPEF